MFLEWILLDQHLFNPKLFWPDFCWTKFFILPNILGPNFFLAQTFLRPKGFFTKNFIESKKYKYRHRPKTYLMPKTLFWTKNSSPKYFWTTILFFKLRLGAFIPRSVGLSVLQKLQNFTKLHKTLQNIIKHQIKVFLSPPPLLFVNIVKELPWRSRHFLLASNCSKYRTWYQILF